jgi:hypothetical protein
VILKNAPVGRISYFQMKYFVIGKEPTHQARLWRCIQELTSKNEEIEFLKMELDSMNDKLEIDELNAEIDALAEKYRNTWGIDGPNDCEDLYIKQIQKQQVEKRQAKRKKDAFLKSKAKIEKKLEETKEEAIFYAEAYESLLKHGHLKPFDDFQSQVEFWNEKLSQDFNLKSMLNKAPDLECLKTILALPNDAEVKQNLLNTLETNKKLIAEKNGG